MEICGTDLSVNQTRLQGIIEGFCEFFPAFTPGDFTGLDAWSGLRPCTPDGLPCIGPVPGLQNVTIATGHSMLGLSLGPVTGKIVAKRVDQTSPDLDIDLSRLSPDRF